MSHWSRIDQTLALYCSQRHPLDSMEKELFYLYRDVYAGKPVTYSNELIRDLLTAISTNDVDLIRAELLKMIKLERMKTIDHFADKIRRKDISVRPERRMLY